VRKLRGGNKEKEESLQQRKSQCNQIYGFDASHSYVGNVRREVAMEEAVLEQKN
jgi:hypothetical protein